jgi:hypothetical protein
MTSTGMGTATLSLSDPGYHGRVTASTVGAQCVLTLIWVTDAALLERLVAESKALGVRRFAMWRLGQEDPAIWGRVVR